MIRISKAMMGQSHSTKRFSVTKDGNHIATLSLYNADHGPIPQLMFSKTAILRPTDLTEINQRIDEFMESLT